MAPLPTVTQCCWTAAHGFIWMLYPFFDGQDGNAAGLSPDQWVALGETIRGVHSALLPTDLAGLVPREAYASRWRDAVRAFDGEADRPHDDPASAGLADLWRAERDVILLLVDRAEELGRRLRASALEQVVCHGDLHGWNVLVGADGALTVVDWDEVILAPKERDLMSVGGGLFGDWRPDTEETLFYEGYGRAEVDRVALAYYRYERMVADVAAYADEIWNRRVGAQDREVGLRQLASQFQPGEVIEIAHRTYAGV